MDKQQIIDQLQGMLNDKLNGYSHLETVEDTLNEVIDLVNQYEKPRKSAFVTADEAAEALMSAGRMIVAGEKIDKAERKLRDLGYKIVPLEKVYRVKLPHVNNYGEHMYLDIDYELGERIVHWTGYFDDASELTEEQIKDIDPSYWSFAEEVTE